AFRGLPGRLFHQFFRPYVRAGKIRFGDERPRQLAGSASDGRGRVPQLSPPVSQRLSQRRPVVPLGPEQMVYLDFEPLRMDVGFKARARSADIGGGASLTERGKP